ncbi:MAG: hypothetical protein V3V75_05645, partial [Thermoguttaceae bacterium]
MRHLTTALAITGPVYLWLAACGPSTAMAGTAYDFELVADGAVIAPASEAGDAGNPSVIRVPDWIPSGQRPNADANYYMYYGDHDDHYIRMRWAETLDGPWTAFNLGDSYNSHTRHGVFDYLSDSLRADYDHVFAPDVHVDNVNERIIMYYHGENQGTYEMEDPPYTKIWKRHTKDFVATSEYGLNFNSPEYAGGESGHGPVWQAADGPVREVIIASDYARVFEWDGGLYSVCKEGVLFKAPNPADPWAPHPTLPYKEEAWTGGPEPSTTFLFSQAFADHPNNPHGVALVAEPEDQRLNHVAVNVLPAE